MQDMFAYSVVLWELFTWQQPYKNVTPEEIQNSILNGERLDVPCSVPDAIRDLIQLGWHQDYKERPHFRDSNLLFTQMDDVSGETPIHLIPLAQSMKDLMDSIPLLYRIDSNCFRLNFATERPSVAWISLLPQTPHR